MDETLKAMTGEALDSAAAFKAWWHENATKPWPEQATAVHTTGGTSAIPWNAYRPSPRPRWRSGTGRAPFPGPHPIMSRKLIIVFGAIAAGCGGVGGSAPVLTAEELREGCVGATLDVLLGACDLLAAGTDAGDVYVRGEPVGLIATAQADGSVTVEAAGWTEATLWLEDDPELGLSVTGTLRTESPDGTVVEGTLDRVFARPAADLPGVGMGALFTAGNVDLSVTSGDEVMARGTAALFGRRALVLLSVGGTPSEAEVVLGR